ncbi:MAG: ImmA/IrrE family metallo-endopeptidase [Magnetococcales bacterium]|nr:ImmA/IrrE family metallo-endopeptidase [Magnetococcales bacterium]
MVEWCAEVGVAVVFVRELPKTGISGATRWLTPDKALIQLSLLYKSDDHLWFTFFHEAGHTLLHGKKDLFLEDEREKDQKKEDEANQFAADLLVPSGQWTAFKQSFPGTLASVENFAKELGIRELAMHRQMVADVVLELDLLVQAYDALPLCALVYDAININGFMCKICCFHHT